MYLRNNALVPYKRSSLDDILTGVKKESGVPFGGHHTLRRTGGRLMWLAEEPIETIASIMGHESTDMTLQYIGVNLSDQTKALAAVRNARIQRARSLQNVPFVAVPEL